MLTLLEWWCLKMPWHRWAVVKEYGRSRHIRCQHCGREYGMNDDVCVVLPWYEVREAYEKPYMRADK
jgi:hypothetical protein